MMREGRQGMNCGNQHEHVGREFVPLVDAMPGRRVTGELLGTLLIQINTHAAAGDLF